MNALSLSTKKKIPSTAPRHAIPEPTCDRTFNFSYSLFKYPEEKD
jgi:hypothetical protein